MLDGGTSIRKVQKCNLGEPNRTECMKRIKHTKLWKQFCVDPKMLMLQNLRRTTKQKGDVDNKLSLYLDYPNLARFAC